MRLFKNRWTARFVRREGVADASLREAIERAERGLIDADLGGGLIKQRIARPSQGRSGGYRMVVVYRTGDRAFFVYGFAKNERENIESDEFGRLENDRGQRATGGHRMTMAKKSNRLREAINEMAEGMHRLGVMDDASYQKITARHLGPDALPIAAPLTGAEIRAVREQTHLSQAALAKYLNITTGYVSQLERGTKEAKGPALVLLNVIRRKGIEALL